MNSLEKKSFKDAPIEIIDGDRGRSYPSKSDFKSTGYCLFLSTSNVKTNGFNFNSMEFISEEKDNLLKKGKLKRGDIVLTTRGTIGNVAYFSESILYKNVRINSGMVILRCDKKYIIPYFLYLFLRSDIFKHQVKSQGSGSAQPQLPISSLKNIVIPWKDISIQEKIVSTISALDSKIELNNQINAELEKMAKTIYDYWFVQFDFPDENGKPYKSSGGKMVWNAELRREIPERWSVNFLGDWIGKDKSGDWGKEEKEGNYTERVFCIRGADLNGLNGKGEVKAPERFILEKNSHKMLEPHDLIVEISGGSPTQSTGRMAYITNDTLQRFDAPIICSNFCKAVTLKEQKSLFNFAFEWNKAYDHGVLFGYEGKTSGIKNLLFESFVSSYLVPFVPILLMEKFYELMTPIESRKQFNLKENQKLSTLRDWLLPMLMNGQVKI
ncbi:restriction endonuclease subunit S [Aquirufa antheringensis]|uniref:restriction endonuclease subunit S n=1 Tax=Aquirufa antheringensis TaxID=2516559 RepID=UPI0022A85B19|nr:restriction endonuclease subunit S [Aquirufa antheringensis]MCZ2478205.1 restriction endonuclease subunit S [Aquirufa antheringensis]